MDTGIWDEIRSKLDFSRKSGPAVFGMAALLAVVAVVAGCTLMTAPAASDFEIEGGKTPAAQEEGEGGEAPTVFVHVSGAVQNPGLYELESGSRVADAVDAAGGFSDDADIDSCNLARAIADGEQVFIQHLAAEDQEPAPGNAAAAQSATGASSGKVNINMASASELESLPGIGSATAAKIVVDRVANGSFGAIEDLKRVPGIGDKKFAALADLICV